MLTHTARRMSGDPQTEDGHRMPLARWYEIDKGANYLVITNFGIYPSDQLGHITNFDVALQGRHVGTTPEGELLKMGIEVVL